MSQDIKCISFVNPKGKKVLIVDFDPRANEELETSREELQSVNEELMTLNSEHQTRIEENLRVINDMNNLFTSTEIATVFLDNDLNIKGFTPASTKIINLIKTDIGRPVKDFSSNLVYENLIDDVLEVLNTLVFRETEVSDKNGNWYLMRIMPYRTTENVIDGGVVTFIDITERKRAEEEIRLLLTLIKAISESKDLNTALEIALKKVCEATGWDYGEVWIPSSVGTIELSPVWYSSATSLEKFRRMSENFTFPLGVGLPGRVWSSKQPEWIPDVATSPETVFPRVRFAIEAGIKASLGIPIITRDQVQAVLLFFMLKSREEDKRLVDIVSGVASQLGTVIQRKRAEQKEKDARIFAEGIVDTVGESLLILDKDLCVISANDSFFRKFNTSKEETENKSIFEINNRSWDIPALRKLLEEILPENTVFNDFEVEMEFPGIGCKKMLLNARRIYEEGVGIERILLAIEDITEQSGKG